MKKIKCYLFGHKAGETNDSGYPVCEQCQSHSYYDDWNKSAILKRPFWFFKRKLHQSKCDIFYWFRVTFTGDKLPF